MKRNTILLTAALIAITGLSFQTASAHRYTGKSSGHFLRVISYPVHTMGYLLERTVTRPVHYFVSQPDIDVVAGHTPRLGEDETYFEVTYPDFKPTIKTRLAAFEDSQRRTSDQ